MDNVRNELIRGETDWSIFEEREAEVMVEWMLRVAFEDNLMSERGRACLIETGCKSRWRGRCRHMCTKFGLIELVNLILLKDVSVNGMVSLGMKKDRNVWKKYICERIQEIGRQSWKNGFNDTEREKECVEMKRCPRNEGFADGSVGARVRLMVMGGCLPVRRSENMAWKYDGDCCGCRQIETEEHVLFECNRYGEERVRLRGVMQMEHGMHEYDVIKSYK